MSSIIKASTAFLCLAVLSAGPTAAQSTTMEPSRSAETRKTSAQRILWDLQYLADDARQGRGVGTVGLDSAAHFLAKRFQEAGLEPAYPNGYLQPFRLDSTAPAIAHSGLGSADVTNIAGVLPGRGALADQAVVIGAHYDHLGLGGGGSLDPDSLGVVHNGADDNASGTAALLETAHILADRRPANARTIVFVAFTAEELGLIGSTHYVKHPARANDVTVAMINFDMVGRLREDALMTIGTGSALELSDLLDSVNTTHGLDLKAVSDPWGRSDHSSFYAAGIPVVHLFTDTHSEYHRTSDDWETINVDGVLRVAEFAAGVATALATRAAPITFVDVPQPRPAAGGGYGASLGTIPDMSESPGGVRLTGVRSGSPADLAGVKGGDIIVQIGTHEVKDLYGMTDALRAHKPGDVVTVVVLRDGERLEFSVTLESAVADAVLDSDAIVRALHAAFCKDATRQELLDIAATKIRETGNPFTGVYMYMLHGPVLRLEASAGRPTDLTEIPVGQGICGQAVARGQDQNIPDVTRADGYLSCSIETKSELVVLIRRHDEILGEIDVDSDTRDGFGESEHDAVREVANALATLL